MKAVIRMKRSQNGEERKVEPKDQMQDQIRRRAFELYNSEGTSLDTNWRIGCRRRRR